MAAPRATRAMVFAGSDDNLFLTCLFGGAAMLSLSIFLLMLNIRMTMVPVPVKSVSECSDDEDEVAGAAINNSTNTNG